MSINNIELINSIIDNRIANIDICLPGKIVDYDHTKQKAKVQPLLNQKYNDGEIVEFPIIHSVPVIHPASGGASITFPVNVGDKVLLVFSQRSLEEWLQNGNQVTPDDSRQNNLTDAVAHIGLRDFGTDSPSSNNTDLLVKYDGSEIKLKPGGAVDIVSSNINMTGNINITGNINVSGDLSVAGKDFITHTHGGVMSGGSTTGPVT